MESQQDGSERSANDTFERIFSDEEKARLRGETFTHREFIGVDFVGADLRDARFHGTSFVRCSLADADLRGAHFILCDLSAVVLSNAILGDNRFDGTTFVSTVGVLEGARDLIERTGGTFLHPYASHR